MIKQSHKLLIILLLLISSQLQAQDYSVRMVCSPKPDSILLRWAPTNSETWRLANQYGYIVKRYTVLVKKKVPKEIVQVQLTPEPLKPAPLNVWEPYADSKYMAIAAECIYGSAYEGVPTGGNPHLAYKKYREEKHRFSFALYAADQSVHAAKLSGLYFVDKSPKQNEKYLYRVYVNAPDTIIVDTAYVFTGVSEYQPLPKPLELRAEWGDKEADLSWNILYLKHIYNSYFIEKSTDGGKSYQRTSENATVQVTDPGMSPDRMYKTDTLDNNTETIYYRVRGISTFGETGPASDSVFGTGILPIKKPPTIVSTDVINNQFVQLNWVYPDEMNKYITGFKIYHSSKPNIKKTLIYEGKDPERRTFIDSSANFTNYYLISVYNNNKEKLSSLRTYAERVDSFPPKPPVGITSVIDSSGVVTLNWQPNTDEDIDGYRVYMANKPKFEFMLITPSVIYDTVFSEKINLKTLTRKIYYKVKAVDVRQNQSAFSELITVTRPDIIPPVSPVIKNIGNTDNLAELSWVNSSSSDVAFHHIYRKYKVDTVYEKVHTLEKTDDKRSVYTDKTVIRGKAYTYYIVAEDESGLISPPSNYGYFKAPSDFVESIKLKKRAYTDRIKLIWSIKAEKSVERILVYRSVNDGPLRLYNNSKENEFMDNKLSPEKTYKYSIKAVYTDGTKSPMSNSVVVKM